MHPGKAKFTNWNCSYANSVLVDQKEVILIKDVSETDQDGRLLRYVIVGNVLVNLEMVKTGFAFTQAYPPDTACTATFSAAEEEARTNQKEMWYQPIPRFPPLQR